MTDDIKITPAGKDHQVVTITSKGGERKWCKKPCKECPWRRENAGNFPAEAFAHSAESARDMSKHVFACHMMGTENRAACAGFLLRGAEHNLSVRLGRMNGDYLGVSEGGADLYEGYTEMAIDNGVDPASPVWKS